MKQFTTFLHDFLNDQVYYQFLFFLLVMFRARCGFGRIRPRQTSQGLNREIQAKNKPTSPTAGAFVMWSHQISS